MGLLDSLLSGSDTNTKFTSQEAFAGILLGASACDGHIADDEVQGLITALLRMKLYQRFTGKQFNQTLNKCHSFLKRKGVDELIDKCAKNLPDDLRHPAFTNACDIVLADGIVEPDEKEFINNLKAKLRLDNETARLIAEIMVVKNKG